MKGRRVIARSFVWHGFVVVVSAMLIGGCADAPSSTPATETAAPPPPAADGANVVVGTAPTPGGGVPAVVILQPQTPGEFPPQAARPVMDQISLTFLPPILLVRTGQPAEFWNSDATLHNVRVRNEVTKEPAFNVALPTGGTYGYTFTTDGFYEVGCDIHPAMTATVIAASTPYATLTDREGKFAFEQVVPGPYKATVYSGAQRIERTIEIGAGRTELDFQAPAQTQ
jgi:plastocyanin